MDVELMKSSQMESSIAEAKLKKSSQNGEYGSSGEFNQIKLNWTEAELINSSSQNSSKATVVELLESSRNGDMAIEAGLIKSR